VNSDLPPFFLYSKFDVAAEGLNVVGLKRAGFNASDLATLKLCYKILYRSSLKKEEACEQLEALANPFASHISRFVRASKRGIAREA
jgi:UDP-N-acetylglucosamine acyltransferase